MTHVEKLLKDWKRRSYEAKKEGDSEALTQMITCCKELQIAILADHRVVNVEPVWDVGDYDNEDIDM